MMMQLFKYLTVCIAAVSVLALSGCETEPSEQAAIAITPNIVSLRPGETQEFVASGWQDYTWEISVPEDSDARGILSTRKGNSTVYTAVSGTNGIVVLHASINVRTANTNGSSENSHVSAEALITHRP